ncbi:MAG: hypothetical protein EPO39_11500 [Candidatus Manganitrophaceae bacterium]|nr:MAG: hypothetical protein EPO39_11500 [Candidatus Manganitrophaceae bacterium]
MIKALRLVLPAIVGCAGIIIFLAGCGVVRSENRQEQIHHMGHDVMPFDLSKTTHIFKMTEEGGVQRVIVKDSTASDQISLIQQHLEHEAARFQSGDFSDPANLHGENMPGLRELHAGASHLKITYTALPRGAEIRFETSDIRLQTAIHRWFGAQLSEHGADAVSE